jgi:hypothetical protein
MGGRQIHKYQSGYQDLDLGRFYGGGGGVAGSARWHANLFKSTIQVPITYLLNELQLFLLRLSTFIIC